MSNLERIIEAAQYGRVEAIRGLVGADAREFGISASALLARTGRSGNTALHMAVINEQDEAVKVLLELDTEKTALHTSGKAGKQPLHLATNETIATLLLEAGADTMARDKQSMLPLHWAAYKGRTGVVTALLAKMKVLASAGTGAAGGAVPTVDTRDRFGRTPLYWAVHSDGAGNIDTVNALLTAGADPLVKDAKRGTTPLEEAHRDRPLFDVLLAKVDRSTPEAKATLLKLASKSGSKGDTFSVAGTGVSGVQGRGKLRHAPVGSGGGGGYDSDAADYGSGNEM